VHDRGMPEVKVTAFRFTEEELELLGIIEGQTGIRSRTEALRKVLQDYVRDESIEPHVSQPKRPKDEGQ
jgi:hypothetical protein